MPLPIFITVWNRLVIGGEQVEILIINDGSQDQTQGNRWAFSQQVS